jgi:hypothetical protein
MAMVVRTKVPYGSRKIATVIEAEVLPGPVHLDDHGRPKPSARLARCPLPSSRNPSLPN